MDEPNWTGVLLVSGVFGGVILVCVGQIVVMYRYSRRGIRVTGVVEQVHAHRSGFVGDTRMGGPAGTRYSATVRYEVGSEQYRIRPPALTNPSFYRKWERVPVYVYPDRPSNGRVVCFREYAKWLAIIIVCAVMAGTFITLGILVPGG